MAARDDLFSERFLTLLTYVDMCIFVGLFTLLIIASIFSLLYAKVVQNRY